MIGFAAFKLLISIGILLPLRLLTRVRQAVDKRQSTPEYNRYGVGRQLLSCVRPGMQGRPYGAAIYQRKGLHVALPRFP